MQTCTNCGHNQNTGKFCEECGGLLQDQQTAASATSEVHSMDANHVNTPETQTAATTVNQTQTNDTVEKVKTGLSQYWNYIVHHIKNPSNSFQSTENNLLNSIVTLVLYAVTFSLSIYLLANSVYKSITSFFSVSESLPFFGMNFRFILGAFIIIAITFGSALAVTKLAKHQDNFKTLLSQYGGLVVPFLALNIIALFGGLIGSATLTLVPLVASNTFMVSIVPAIFVYEKSSQVDTKGLKVYHSFLTVLIIAIISYIISDFALSNLFEEISEIMYYL
ncbi:DUF6574 domain-containing protein [Ornithinibacillus halotolerans]|uniref:Zinc ribbon domain-containing protein n=1 Tax=Ornithinibacillus halotolerans TaxID=1274357 RepID=A0A916S198_9BACI|nr:DUF6574 domain-containing protein [Ornithinibacillus halotolerans]GGA79098.1 hypothetical protein GCM10008025_23170 [Ornithinibacillus halotolerans]